MHIGELFNSFKGGGEPVKEQADPSNEEYVNKCLRLEYARIERARQGYCYCKKCGDTGLLPTKVYDKDLKKFYLCISKCNCVNAEAVRHAIEASGLEKELESKTFAKFKTDTDFRKGIKERACEYIEKINKNNKYWFYIGGQSGAGKSHICTAIANKFLQNNCKLKYMRWVDELRQIKSNFGSSKIQELKGYDVLYIDDLFKGTKQPSEYDVGVAFEIINYRDSNDLVTIISSELMGEELKSIDEAIHGRIKAHTAGDRFMISIQPDNNKNYRLKGENISLWGNEVIE